MYQPLTSLKLKDVLSEASLPVASAPLFLLAWGEFLSHLSGHWPASPLGFKVQSLDFVHRP